MFHYSTSWIDILLPDRNKSGEICLPWQPCKHNKVAFRLFFIHKGINRIIHWRSFDKTVHDLKKSFAQVGEPFFEVRILFSMCFPESFLPGSTPEKAVRASRCVKRETSPISAINCGPRVSPTPFISMTTGYSGSVDASSFIFEWSDSTVSEAAFSNATACNINILVISSFGNTAIRSEEI